MGIRIILIFIFYSFACTAQNNDTAAQKKAKDILEKKYNDLKDLKWEIDDHGNLEGHFKYDDQDLRADFTLDGSWIETERSINWGDLPKEVQNAIEAEFDKDDIAEMEYVEHHKKGAFYDIEFKQPGKNKDVEYNAKGKRL